MTGLPLAPQTAERAAGGMLAATPGSAAAACLRVLCYLRLLWRKYAQIPLTYIALKRAISAAFQRRSSSGARAQAQRATRVTRALHAFRNGGRKRELHQLHEIRRLQESQQSTFSAISKISHFSRISDQNTDTLQSEGIGLAGWGGRPRYGGHETNQCDGDFADGAARERFVARGDGRLVCVLGSPVSAGAGGVECGGAESGAAAPAGGGVYGVSQAQPGHRSGASIGEPRSHAGNQRSGSEQLIRYGHWHEHRTGESSGPEDGTRGPEAGGDGVAQSADYGAVDRIAPDAGTQRTVFMAEPRSSPAVGRRAFGVGPVQAEHGPGDGGVYFPIAEVCRSDARFRAYHGQVYSQQH